MWGNAPLLGKPIKRKEISFVQMRFFRKYIALDE